MEKIMRSKQGADRYRTTRHFVNGRTLRDLPKVN